MVLNRKLVAVGDYCGKTFVIRTFLRDELPEPQVTFLQLDVTDVEANGTLVELHVWDTCSKERFTSLRITQYKNTDVFLVFFSIYGQKTFENVEKEWVPEVRKFGPKNAPIILVGTHCNDFVMDMRGVVVSEEDARRMMKKVGAVDYVECSADNKYNVEEVFVRAVAATLEKKK